MKTLELKHAIRNKFAWPGGYPLFLVMDDGEPLCIDCGRKEYKNIYQSTKHNERDGWNCAGVDVNYEDNNCVCAHCNKKIDPAYEQEVIA